MSQPSDHVDAEESRREDKGVDDLQHQKAGPDHRLGNRAVLDRLLQRFRDPTYHPAHRPAVDEAADQQTRKAEVDVHLAEDRRTQAAVMRGIEAGEQRADAAKRVGFPKRHQIGRNEGEIACDVGLAHQPLAVVQSIQDPGEVAHIGQLVAEEERAQATARRRAVAQQGRHERPGRKRQRTDDHDRQVPEAARHGQDDSHLDQREDCHGAIAADDPQQRDTGAQRHEARPAPAGAVDR